jgi:MerR family transcriptional regulator/heat shock protein HspR
VQRLSQDEGVNLAGIKRIIELTNQVEALQARLAEVTAELERVRKPSTALVLWEPRRRGNPQRG